MKTEIEVKFINVNVDEIRAKLKFIGAECHQPMRKMRRQVFYLVDDTDKDAFVRVRDEGDKVTMTFKRFEDDGLHGAKEVEVVVSDFTDAQTILANTGLKPKSYQETRRETWALGTTEVVIDEWPWLEPFIEIEGQSEEDVRDVAGKLGYHWDSEAVFGSSTVAFRLRYPNMPADFIMDELPEIRFGAPRPKQLVE